MGREKHIYVLHAASDHDVVSRFLPRFKALEKRYAITIWDDDPIHDKQAWQPRDIDRLERTDLFVLLLSNAFMYSEFVGQLEFKKIIDQYKEGKAKVIPIILDDCPWGINFESDDYNFSFKELKVLPEGKKPLKKWDSPEVAIENAVSHIEQVIVSIAETLKDKDSPQKVEKENANTVVKDQLALDFEKQAEAKRKAREELERQEEAKKKVAEEKSKHEAEIREKAIEEKKRQDDAEKKRIEEEKRLKQEAEAKRREQEAQRLQQEAEAKRITEAKRLAEEERLRKEGERQKRIEEEQRRNVTEKTVHPISENQDKNDSDQRDNQGSKRKMLIVLLLAAMAIIAIFLFTRLGNDGGEEASPAMVSDSLNVEETTDTEQPEADDSEKENKEAELSKLVIGDTYDGGIVFDLDPSGKSGKIAYIDDAGPMPWQDAMIIHDQLGPGWRLPTLDELQTMYRNIGQGSDNSGEFSNGLYWSATDYDEYQARLLRFRDGNTSYHYNKAVESRRFLVRAIRDFSR